MNRPAGQGVRQLRLDDQAPDCTILIGGPLYDLNELVEGRVVLDVGCGYGTLRSKVEDRGGIWIGLEPFSGGTHSLQGSAEQLPVRSQSVDLVVMNAVLEHIPDVGKAFGEVQRVLRHGGKFIGYVAFMECFHEISYSHLSFKALEHYAEMHGLRLEGISGGRRFGIGYHLRVLLYPLPIGWAERPISAVMRSIFRLKAVGGFFAMYLVQRRGRAEARRLATLYYQIECLRQSVGFSFVIDKPEDSHRLTDPADL